MSLASLYGPYFSSRATVLALVLPVVSIVVAYWMSSRSQSPRVRSWSLGFTLVSSVFLWLFIGMSLVLCLVFSQTYQSALAEGVKEVFGDAILIALVGGIPLTLILRQASPRIILERVKELHDPPVEVSELCAKLAEKMGVVRSQLRLSNTKLPISFVVHTDAPTVVMSDKLLTLLDADELETVLAHELAHIKNSDTALKSLVTAYRVVLPMDPIIRLVEGAFHKVREMVADETAARITSKPLSLASALLKISGAFPGSNLASQGSYSILGAQSPLSHSHTRERIERLIQLANSGLIPP